MEEVRQNRGTLFNVMDPLRVKWLLCRPEMCSVIIVLETEEKKHRSLYCNQAFDYDSCRRSEIAPLEGIRDQLRRFYVRNYRRVTRLNEIIWDMEKKDEKQK